MMGLTPRAVDALTLPEFSAMLDGFGRFQGAEDPAEEPDEAAFFRALAESRL